MKRKMKKGVKAYTQLPVKIKGVNKEAGTLEAIFSTQDVDRHGDTVMQEGWDLKNFKKNPVILNSHNYSDAAEVIGKASNLKIEGKKLTGKITFAVNENPKAKVIFDLYAGGFLNAFSVGFMPQKFKENKDGTRDWYTIEEAELLEVSAVSVPANARALAKAKGIDVDELPDEMIEDEDTPTEDEEVETPEDNPEEATDEPTEEENEEVEETPEEEPETPTEEPEETTEDTPDEDQEEESEEVEEEPTPEPAPKSYNAKVLGAIKNIESKEKRVMRKTAEIINSLLQEEDGGVKLNAKTREQIRKRKVNKAIRMLFTIK